jgi:hypothetical protein
MTHSVELPPPIATLHPSSMPFFLSQAANCKLFSKTCWNLTVSRPVVSTVGEEMNSLEAYLAIESRKKLLNVFGH